MSIHALFDFYDDLTGRSRELTNAVIVCLVNDYGAVEKWIDVGAVYYSVSGLLIGVAADGKEMQTAEDIAHRLVDTTIGVVLGLCEPFGKWIERNERGREEVKYSEWRNDAQRNLR